MTDTTPIPTPAPGVTRTTGRTSESGETVAAGGTRAAALRLTAVAVALAGVLPYLTLKIIWLTGGTLGIADPAWVRDGALFGLNLLTFAMDAVATLILLAFVLPWGRRIPAGAILPPMWVGIGLLVPIAVEAPLGFLIDLLSGTPLSSPNDPVAGWVYLVVYTGFTCQAIGLTVGFLHHARSRWPGVFTSRVSEGAASRTRELQTFVAWGIAGVSVILAAINLTWLLGSTGGLSVEVAGERSVFFFLRAAVNTLLPLAVAIGLLTIVRGRSDRRLRGPVILAWLGSGAMFAWPLWEMIIRFTPTELSGRGAGDAGVLGLVSLFTLLTGLVAGMTGAFALVDRVRSAAPRPR
ncbi:hypothetical protein AB0395_39280 [Streptosporangium sp. NPDC051023]|uniref:hypothetical protein n=1 Tax=Streptosporangium sp. NPDC051023 TaxID=3155410 RepID=UPI00344C38D9